MKKKFLSVLLVFVMILSLTACGSKDKVGTSKKSGSKTEGSKKESTLSDVVEAVKNVDAKSIEISGEALGYKASAKASSDGDNYAMSVEFEGKKVTDIILYEDVLYINIKDAAAFADSYIGEDEYTSILKELNIDAEYVSFDSSQTEKIINDYDLNYYYDLSQEASEDIEVVRAIQEALVKFASDYTNSIKNELGDVLKVNGTYTTLTLNNENVKSALSAMKNGDVRPYVEALANDLSKLEQFADEDLDVDEGVEEFNDMIDEAIEEFKDIDEETQFNIKSGFGVKNGKLVLSFSGEATCDGKKYNASVEMTTSNKAGNIKKPTSVVTYDEINDIMDQY